MELLYGVGIAIVAALLWRAVLWFREYRHSLRIKLEPVPPGPDGHFPELGKVRVRPRITARRDDDEDEPSVHAAAAPAASGGKVEVEIARSELAPEPEAMEEDNLPVLLTPVAPAAEEVQHDMFAHEPIAPPPLPSRSSVSAQTLYERQVEPVRPVRAEPEVRPHVDVQEVIALHVVAREHPFNGEDLLRCILSYGLRYGEMSIFHRHERPTGQGRILFSMAKAVEPGTFDLEAMTGEEIPGVSFFLSLPGVNSIHAYDIMVDSAKRLATELQGEILDEQQQPLTRQLVEHYRERVQEFERRRLMQRPFS